MITKRRVKGWIRAIYFVAKATPWEMQAIDLLANDIESAEGVKEDRHKYILGRMTASKARQLYNREFHHEDGVERGNYLGRDQLEKDNG